MIVFGIRPLAAQHDALRQAALDGNVEAVHQLLAAGHDPNAYRQTYSPLMFAAQQGHAAVMRLLLDAGADPEHRDHNGDRALLWAAEGGDPEAVALLLAAGSPPDRTADPHGRSPLMRASRYGNKEAVALLLAAGADPNRRNLSGDSALHAAVLARSADIVRLLLARGADPDAATESLHDTPLHLAAVRGLAEIAAMLVAAGAETELQDAGGRTALWWAAHRDFPDIIRILLAAGADPCVEAGGVTAFAAAAAGDGAAARLLVDLTQDRDAGLAAAAWGGHFDLVQRLLARGADINATDDRGRPAIAAAVLAEGVAILEWFIANGADLHQSGAAALHEAVRHDRADLVLSLLDAGVPVDAPDTHGASALLGAAGSGLVSMVRLLLENGADASARDGSGRSVEDYMQARRRELDWQQQRIDRSRALIRIPELDLSRRDLSSAYAKIRAILAAAGDRREE